MGIIETVEKQGFMLTSLDAVIKWAQSNSMWPNPLGLSCCGIELMHFGGSKFDAARFGSEVMRMTPRQSDFLLVAGTVTYKMAMSVRKLYDQMADPKWVLAMGACASSGGMFRSYSVVQGIENFLPVDVYVSGCPPRPENLIQGLMRIQELARDKRYRPVMANMYKEAGETPREGRFLTK